MANNRILVISDTHAPYHHPDALKFLGAIKADFNPDRIIHIGDEIDNHAISFHDSDPDLYGASEELSKAREFVWEVERLFPRVDVLESNHGSLWYRKAKHHGIPRDMMRSYEEVLMTQHWKWHFDLRLTLPNGQPCYFHHAKNANALISSQHMGMSVVQGHHHERFNIQYWGTSERLNWGMNVGCLVDDKSLAFAYNKVNLKRPVIGCGMIIDSQPRLLPLVMKSNGRWTGKLV